jgi:UDP-glucose 4-epimerase
MTKRVLISGAAGFIGSHVAQACLDEGWEVDGVDDLSNGHKEFMPKLANFLDRDFANPNVLDNIKSQKYDYVFHLAAKARVTWSVEHPLESNNDNVTKSLMLINACKGNIKRFIFSSSSSVYGNTCTLPTSEREPLFPGSPYALQKLIVENYLKLYYDMFKLDSICLRYFNVYGPHQVGGSPYATALGNWLAAIINDEYLRFDGDGSQKRDLVYVADVAQANVIAAKHDRKCGKGFDILNIGTGYNVSNREILQMLGERFGKLKVQYAPSREGDVRETKASTVAASTLIKFSAQTDFVNTGFDKTVEWALTTSHMKTLRSTTG